MDSFSGMWPPRYSPIQPATGNGNQKAYLCAISEQLCHAVLTLSGDPFEGILGRLSGRVGHFDFDLPSDDIALEDTEQAGMVKSRKGQGRFRRNVSEIERGCRITGVNKPELLIASHIKPWRCCETAAERLDGNNGLLLSPTVDRLFDRGLIGFTSNGRVLVTSRLEKEVLIQLGLKNLNAKSVGAFNDKQSIYLAYHREFVFLDGMDRLDNS